MGIFKTLKECKNSNRIVKELNATVCTSTFIEGVNFNEFEQPKGIFKADLYNCKNSFNKLVKHGSCGPVNGEFAKTVLIEF